MSDNGLVCLCMCCRENVAPSECQLIFFFFPYMGYDRKAVTASVFVCVLLCEWLVTAVEQSWTASVRVRHMFFFLKWDGCKLKGVFMRACPHAWVRAVSVCVSWWAVGSKEVMPRSQPQRFRLCMPDWSAHIKFAALVLLKTGLGSAFLQGRD